MSDSWNPKLVDSIGFLGSNFRWNDGQYEINTLKNSPLKVVVGLGKTGLSCVRYLKSRGFHVAVTDSRTQPPGVEEIAAQFPDVELALGGFNKDLMAKASELVVSPGVSIKEPVINEQIKKGIPVVGDVELFAKHTSKPIVAITGSNGKSTVTSLVGHLALQAGLRAKVGGNIGLPVLEMLDDENTQLYIVELSSFQLETTYSLNSLSCVNLNISQDHMDRYDTIDDYIRAKLRIYENCKHPVINLDDKKSYQGFNFKNFPLGFTIADPVEGVFGLRNLPEGSYLSYGKQNLIPTKSLFLRGQHQYANALAALAIGYSIGLTFESMVAALPTFQGLTHRCQWIANIDGVAWYNDSKATNVGSALAAIEGIGPEIDGKIILLAGGLGKNADFSELQTSIKKYVRTLILFGQDKHLIAAALDGSAPINIIEDDLTIAVNLAKENAKAGDAVVLAPACASYDMFRDFEHRGEVFMQIVRGMIH